MVQQQQIKTAANAREKHTQTHTNPEREDANSKEGKGHHSRPLSSPKLTYDEDDGVHTNSSTKIWLTNTVVIKKTLKSLRALEKDPNRLVDRVFTSKIKCHPFIRLDCAPYTVAKSEASATSNF
jgi:hypothetical protein